MECNKDEALRAKTIAERKFKDGDLPGAQKFALKAQNLFPGLDGINQMLATLDVYIAAERDVNGERDWYAILSVQAAADAATIKKQYRKSALQLHPDKNKFLGAEGAFKLISEAWSVLSDKSRKLLYDQRRGEQKFQQRASQSHRGPSVPNGANGFHNHASNTTSTARGQKRKWRGTQPANPPSCPLNSDAFWTSCHHCNMRYKYLQVYCNHNLRCPNCRKTFMAVDIGLPTS